MIYDVVIVGGGPAGLAAALALGRARKQTVLCDAGPRRNAAASHVYNFLTRDGMPPAEMRRVGREQLTPYSSIETRDESVTQIAGERGAFEVRFASGSVQARRILLCTGMIDVLPEINGFRDAWGKSIFQCPYCHGWEIQDRAFGVLAANLEMLEFALLLRGWSRSVVVFSNDQFEVPAAARERLRSANIQFEERSIARLVPNDTGLERLEFQDGSSVPIDVLFARPRQRQVALVEALGLALDPMGYVQVSDPHRETSVPGIYAAGDLVTMAQAAVMAAASGVQAAAMLNHALTIELATSGALT